MSAGTAVIRQPVDITTADLADATAKLYESLEIAARYVPEIDVYSIGQLGQAVMEATHRGEARTGLRLQTILENARVGSGHARQRHFRPELSELADLTIRLAAISSPRRAVRCECLFAAWAKTGRDRNSLATDRIRNVTPGMRFAGLAVSCDDRHLPTSEIPFTAGTRHDYSSDRADPDGIARLEAKLGRRPSGTPAEHFDELLSTQRRARARLSAGLGKDGGTLLAEAGFSDLVIAGAMPYGPATKRTLDGATTYWPGGDADLIDVLAGAGKQGVAHLGRRDPNGKHPPTQAELEGNGFIMKPFGRTSADERLATDVEWGVTWFWRRESDQLLRVQLDEGAVRIDDWRVIGLANDLDVAVALVRRHEQQWMGSCLARVMIDTAPGLIEVSSYRSDAGLRDLLRVGNAALVDADRVGRARAAAG